MHFIDARVMRDPPRRPLVVTGHQHGRQPGLAQPGDGLDRIGLQVIAEREDAERAAIARDGDDATALFLQHGDALEKGRQVDPSLSKQLRAADNNVVATDSSDDAFPG